MSSITDIIDRIDLLKHDLRASRKELEIAIEKTDLFQKVFSETMKAQYAVCEKDARRHAITVCIKNFS